jgi:Na+/melibiose symporter-like transporter
MTDVTTAKDRVKPFWLFAYSLPGLPVAAMSLPLAVYLPPFYESDVGLGNLTVGIIFGATRFLDVFLDPIMGVLSDRTQTRWGRRKIWMALAVPVMCLASLLVFMPQPGATWPSVVASIFLLFVGYTMLSIAHLAWGSELSSDYHERSKVTASREFAYLVGMIAVLLLPAVIQARGGDKFAQIASMGWFVVGTLPFGVAFALWAIPEKKQTQAPVRMPLRPALKAILNNRPLRYVLLSDLVAGISGGVVATLFIYMVTFGLQLPKAASWLLIVYFLMGAIAIPPMIWLSKKLGKHQTFVLSCVVNAVLLPCFFFLPKGEIVPAIVLFTLLGLNMSAGPFLFRAIMADVADHDHAETGEARAGVYFSLLALTNKLGYSCAIFLSYALLAYVGFSGKGNNSPEAVTSMMFMYVVPPTLISLGIGWVMWHFPIDENRQRELRDIIEGRAKAAAQPEPQVLAVDSRPPTPGFISASAD